jgi:hypothetical protein
VNNLTRIATTARNLIFHLNPEKAMQHSTCLSKIFTLFMPQDNDHFISHYLQVVAVLELGQI